MSVTNDSIVTPFKSPRPGVASEIISDGNDAGDSKDGC